LIWPRGDGGATPLKWGQIRSTFSSRNPPCRSETCTSSLDIPSHTLNYAGRRRMDISHANGAAVSRPGHV